MSKPSWPSNKLILSLVWIVALAIRLYGATTKAQPYDIGTFEAWSRSIWSSGPRAFFGSVWSDYMPLPILTFAPISLLANLVHAPFGLVFKLVHLTVELILIGLLPSSLVLPKLLLFLSPALIGDTAFWGQVDTIPALLALLALSRLTLAPAKAYLPPLLFGLSVAYKPIMILIAPILWIVDIKRGHKWRFPLISTLVFLSTGIPTGGLQFAEHLFSRALAQSGTYPFLTINAFNFWSLIPSYTWVADTTSILSLSGKTLGLILFAGLSLVTLANWRRQHFNPRFAYRVAATILIIFYTFTTRMHERHLLFGLPFLALASFYESWLLVPFLILTATFTLNLWGAFVWVVHNQTWPFSLSQISLISWVTTLTTLALATIWSWPKSLRSTLSLLKTHKLLLAILLLASCLRFIHLSYPSTYIFDEVYHAFTAREYLHNHIEAWEWWTTPPKGVAYEWTHPPVAKYGMVIGMLFFGENSFGWRFGSAVFGVLSILGLYLFIHALTKNKNLALLSAFLVSIEGLHLAQSRIAMNDIYMLCFYLWSLYAAVKSRWKTAAILFGLSLASKWSALYGVVPLAFIYLQQNILSSRAQSKDLLLHLLKILRLLLIALAVYVLTFAPFVLAGHTWAQWWELQRQMWYYHTHLVATHAYQSTPLQWLFDVRPVWYYVNYLSNQISNIYVLGNPIILWFGLVAVALQFKKIFTYPYSLLYLLYFILFLPWVLSPRIMFFYHYLPSSIFLCVLLASLIIKLPPRLRFLLFCLCTLGLLVIGPMLYGIAMPTHYWDVLFKIIPSWK